MKICINLKKEEKIKSLYKGYFMKKILITSLMGISFLFASNNEDINKKLDLLINKINQLEKKVDEKDKKIEELQKEIKTQKKEINKEVKNELALKSCDKIKVSNLKYEYNGDVIPYYNLTFTLKNEYPKGIVYLVGNLFAEDKDGTIILKDYIKRKINLPVNGKVTIHKSHTLNNDLEKYLKDENPKDLHIYFKVIKAKFKDGESMECEF